MTMDEVLMLERGRVPAQPIIEAVTRYVRENGEELRGGDLDLACLGFVAERANVSHQTLVTWVENPERAGAIPFPIADRLLCASEQWNLWYGELSEYYMRVDLSWQECERDGCHTWFQAWRQLGPKRSRFCSRTCGQMQHMADKGAIKSAKKHNAKTHCRNGHRRTEAGVDANGSCRQCEHDRAKERTAGLSPEKREQRAAYQHSKYLEKRTKCSKGHEFTPENTILLRSGKRRCRACNNATSAAGYHRRREAA